MGPIGSYWKVRIPLMRVAWQGGEVLALRAWRLMRYPLDGGLRLMSLTRDTIWHGPVLAADQIPTADPGTGSGVYATKPGRRPRISVPHPSQTAFDWLTGRDTWIWGWVSLYGQVIEHTEGYRAQAAIVRRLHLGVQTLLAFPEAEARRQVIRELEERYRCPVKVGHWERRKAFRVGWDTCAARRPLPKVPVANLPTAPPVTPSVRPPLPVPPPSPPPVARAAVPVPPPVPRPPRPPRGMSGHGLAFADVVHAFMRAEVELGARWNLSGVDHCRRVTLDGRYSRKVRLLTRSWQRLFRGFPGSRVVMFPLPVVLRAAEILKVKPAILIGREY